MAIRQPGVDKEREKMTVIKTCLLYTSDAADERSSVDLGGRRIIKKKKTREYSGKSEKINKKD